LESTYSAASRWLENSNVQYAPNPKKGKSFERYAAYEKATTVGEALSLGSLPADLLFDYEHGYLKVAEPLRESRLDLFDVKSFDTLTYTDMVLCRYLYLVDSDAKDSGKFHDLEESLRRQKANTRRLRNIQIAAALEIEEVDAMADSIGSFETPVMMARRSVAQEQAREMLEAVDREKRKVTDFEVLQVLRLWDFRENTTRLNVMLPGMTHVYSDTMGLVADRTGHILSKEETRRYPVVNRLFNRWLRDNMPGDLANFVCTSININKNYAGRLHRDGNNVGPSLIKAFGDFTGGQLNYFPDDDRSQKLEELETTAGAKSVKINVSNGLAMFDGKRGHWVDDFEGERYTLVFFTCPRFEKMSDDTRVLLESACFPLPSEEKVKEMKTVLRPPGETVGDAYKFWPSTDAKRSLEAEVETFWKKQGLREVVNAGTVKFPEWEHRKDKRGVSWNEDHAFFVLSMEPERNDLILSGYKNMVDAVRFLNTSGEVPPAVQEAGCCAVFSNRTRVWYALYKIGTKHAAMETFGQTVEVPKPKRGRNESTHEAIDGPSKKPDCRDDPSTAKRVKAESQLVESSLTAVEGCPKQQVDGKDIPSKDDQDPTPKKRRVDQGSNHSLTPVKQVKCGAEDSPRENLEDSEARIGRPQTGKSRGRPCLMDRMDAMEKLGGCTADTCIEFQAGGKTAASHAASYQRYEKYSSARTMQQAIDLGAGSSDILYDFQTGLLKVVADRPKTFDKLAKKWREATQKRVE